jgi:predicted PurR-regulated permease PerM
MSSPRPSRSARATADASVVLRAGRIAWALVGIVAAAAIGYAAISTVSGLVVPLVVAAVLGVLLHPLVDRMARRGVRRGIGAGIVLAAIVAITVAAVWVTVVGIVDQSAEITRQLSTGITELEKHVDLSTTAVSLESRAGQLVGGLASLFGSVFSSAAAFLIGTVVAVFFLYYMLADWPTIESLFARHARVGRVSGRALIDDVTGTLRAYFGVLTYSSFATAVLIGIGAVVLGVPLAFAIALVTFVTSYVPYIGAVFSGAFAVLIALGAVGVGPALILLAIILVVQNLVQTVLVTKLSNDRMHLHPIVNIGSTIVGAALAGLLGATLSAPVTVMVRDVIGRQRDAPDRDAEPAGTAHGR